MHRRRIMQHAPDLVSGFGEFGAAAHDGEIGARTLVRHVHNILHVAVHHDDDAIGDQHRFIEVMGDE